MDALVGFTHRLMPDRETQNTVLTVTTTLAATIAFLAIANRITRPKRPSVLPSPLKTLLPSLTPEQRSQLLYPPDFFPGARDVPTPYGSIRCYEFGPVTGRKVLFLHGISTS